MRPLDESNPNIERSRPLDAYALMASISKKAGEISKGILGVLERAAQYSKGVHDAIDKIASSFARVADDTGDPYAFDERAAESYMSRIGRLILLQDILKTVGISRRYTRLIIESEIRILFPTTRIGGDVITAKLSNQDIQKLAAAITGTLQGTQTQMQRRESEWKPAISKREHGQNQRKTPQSSQNI